MDQQAGGGSGFGAGDGVRGEAGFGGWFWSWFGFGDAVSAPLVSRSPFSPKFPLSVFSTPCHSAFFVLSSLLIPRASPPLMFDFLVDRQGRV